MKIKITSKFRTPKQVDPRAWEKKCTFDCTPERLEAVQEDLENDKFVARYTVLQDIGYQGVKSYIIKISYFK